MIHDIIEKLNNAEQKLHSVNKLLGLLREQIWKDIVAKDVLPPTLPPPYIDYFETAHQDLAEALEKVHAIRDGWNLVLLKLLNGQKLEEGEFYILRSIELVAGLESEYDQFLMLLYEDDQRRGYINGVSPKPGHIKLRFGIYPEVVKVSYLSEEQKVFFRDRCPEIWARFDHSSSKV